jgi:hypothetical protein
MAILKNGIAGHYSGKMGNLVFYTLNGKQVSRTIGKITKAPTERQLKNRMEMKVVNQFLKFITEFINVGFQLKAKGTVKTPYNLAVSYNKVNAVKGLYPDMEMDYERVQLTAGNLPGAMEPAVLPTAAGLAFTWLCPDNMNWAAPADQVMLLVYFPRLAEAVYVLYGTKRAECQTVLHLRPELLGEYMEVYISFISNDRKRIAGSTYLGSINPVV